MAAIERLKAKLQKTDDEDEKAELQEMIMELEAEKNSEKANNEREELLQLRRERWQSELEKSGEFDYVLWDLIPPTETKDDFTKQAKYLQEKNKTIVEKYRSNPEDAEKAKDQQAREGWGDPPAGGADEVKDELTELREKREKAKKFAEENKDTGEGVNEYLTLDREYQAAMQLTEANK